MRHPIVQCMGQDGGIGLPTFVSDRADRKAGVGVRAGAFTPGFPARTGSDGNAAAARPKITDAKTSIPWTTPHAARSLHADGEHRHPAISAKPRTGWPRAA